jgi:uncharacterized protein (TIGR00369 family)
VDDQHAALLTFLQRALSPSVVSPWVLEMGLVVLSARPGEVVLQLPVKPALVHGGGVLCGQAIMAAADTAMVLAVMSQLGQFKPMTTVQLQTSFLKGVPGDSTHAQLTARILRMGRNLVFGEVLVHTAKGDLGAHATTTYALL